MVVNDTILDRDLREILNMRRGADSSIDDLDQG